MSTDANEVPLYGTNCRNYQSCHKREEIGKRHLVCSGCRAAQYCSKACQSTEQDWKRHKEHCEYTQSHRVWLKELDKAEAADSASGQLSKVDMDKLLQDFYIIYAGMIHKVAAQILELYKYQDPIPVSAYQHKIVLFRLRRKPETTSKTKAKSAFSVLSVDVMEEDDFYRRCTISQRNRSKQRAKHESSQGSLQLAITCEECIGLHIRSISNDMAAETFYYPPWREAFSRLVEMGLGMSGLRELEISG